MSFGDVIKSFATPSTLPVGIAVVGNYLWVADNDGSVDVVDRNGNVIESYTSDLAAPRDIVLVGNRFFQCDGTTDSASIGLFDRKFNRIKEMDIASTTARNLQGIAFDGRYIWASEGGVTGQRDLHQFSVDGINLRELSPALDGQPLGVEVIGGRILYTDHNNDLLVMLDIENGKEIKRVATPSTLPRAFAFDGKYLWLVDSDADLVYQLSLQ